MDENYYNTMIVPVLGLLPTGHLSIGLLHPGFLPPSILGPCPKVFGPVRLLPHRTIVPPLFCKANAILN